MVTNVLKEPAAPSFTLKMEEAGFSETLVLFYPTTVCHIPQDSSYCVVVRMDFS
jgi:hypothetical protein